MVDAVALIASLSWLMPWYVGVAAAAGGTRVERGLRRVAAVLTVYLLFVFLPAVNTYTNNHNINLLDTPAGRASSSLQYKLGPLAAPLLVSGSA